MTNYHPANTDPTWVDRMRAVLRFQPQDDVERYASVGKGCTCGRCFACLAREERAARVQARQGAAA